MRQTGEVNDWPVEIDERLAANGPDICLRRR